MKKIKYFIGILLVIMTIGFAALSTSLSIRGTTQVVSVSDDFKVYFSRVLINGIQDHSIVENETQLKFSHTLQTVGDSYTITYDITNASKFYDAKLAIKCTEGNNHFSIVNEFNTTDYLLAKETRQGSLTLTKSKTIANVKESNVITCTIDATPIERTSTNDDPAPQPIQKYFIGKEIIISEEKFNIIGSDETTITLLAQNLLGENYRQTTQNHGRTFSSEIGWEYTPGPKEIDIKTWSPGISNYLNQYKEFLKSELSDENIQTDLITLSQLKQLQCTIPKNYVWDETTANRTCTNSPYASWLIINYNWWTRSAYTNVSDKIWYISNAGNLWGSAYNLASGIRPIVTISKETIEPYC